MRLWTGSRDILMKIVVMTRLVTRGAVNRFAGMRYGPVVDHRNTYKHFQEQVFARALHSSPKPHKLTPPPRASQQAVSQPASGVRYTDGHYTCSTADIRVLRAAGYDSSSSRQTIRYQRRCSGRAVQRDRLQREFSTSTFACSARTPPLCFQRASQLLRIFI